MPGQKKRVTIVTVCWNSAGTLARTIQSVLENKAPDIEYVIVDGGSTDGTIDIIKSYSHVVDRWISEPDKGLYDAMNKGLGLASGEYVGFLNSDDWLVPRAFERILGSPLEVDFFFSIALLVHPDRSVEGLYRAAVGPDRRLNDVVFQGTPLPHPTLYCRTTIARTIGFDLRFSRAADYDFMLRLFEMSGNYVYFPEIFVNFQTGGMSTKPGNSELFKVQLKNLSSLLRFQFSSRESRYQYVSYLYERSHDPLFQFDRDDIKALLDALDEKAIERSVAIRAVFKGLIRRLRGKRS